MLYDSPLSLLESCKLQKATPEHVICLSWVDREVICPLLKQRLYTLLAKLSALIQNSSLIAVVSAICKNRKRI